MSKNESCVSWRIIRGFFATPVPYMTCGAEKKMHVLLPYLAESSIKKKTSRFTPFELVSDDRLVMEIERSSKAPS